MMRKKLLYLICMIGMWGCAPYNHGQIPASYTTAYRPLTPAEQQQRAQEIDAIHQQRDAMAEPARVIVTTGPLGQPYRALGEVHVNTGMINVGSLLNDALFRSQFERAVSGPTPTAHANTLNQMLREAAVRQYGKRVDAVVNVTYRTDPDGDVFASGLAVELSE